MGRYIEKVKGVDVPSIASSHLSLMTYLYPVSTFSYVSFCFSTSYQVCRLPWPSIIAHACLGSRMHSGTEKDLVYKHPPCGQPGSAATQEERSSS